MAAARSSKSPRGHPDHAVQLRAARTAPYPHAGLVQATDGNFYGTTEYGGTSGNCGADRCGTIFKITPAGTLTTLHSFDGTDGAAPYGALIQATDGNFYGTTEGGNSGGHYDVYGTVFSLTAGPH